MIKVEDQHVTIHGPNEEIQDEFEHLLLAMTSNEELMNIASGALTHVNELLKAKGGI